jgi:hypothetical protein
VTVNNLLRENMKKTLVMLLALNSAMIYAASEATVICSPEAK